MGADMSAEIEDELVQERKRRPCTGVDDFHRWLTTARLLAVSHGRYEIDRQIWQRARDLDSRRLAFLCDEQF